MDWVRKWVTQIQAFLSDLSVSTKLLVLTLGGVVFAIMILVAVYAGRPQFAPVIDQPLSSS